MNDELDYLLKIRFGKDKAVEGRFLGDGDKVNSRQAAMRIVGAIPEEQISDVFNYLSEVVAELVAMSDDTDDTLNNLYRLTVKRIREFRRYREDLVSVRNSKQPENHLS